MKILFLGDTTPYCGAWQRLEALRRLGHEVEAHDIHRLVVRGRWGNQWHYRTGFRFVTGAVLRRLQGLTQGKEFDLAWIDGGEVFGCRALALLRVHARLIVNYNCDDPTGPRDWARWHTLRSAIPNYDLMVTVREPTLHEFRQRGARKAMMVFRSYDDILLEPVPQRAEDLARWTGEVVFVGTWMPERGPFLAALARAGVPLSIHGNRWDRAPEWPELRHHFRGPGVVGPDYARLLQGARIGLGLLSKGNRDLHTIRSSEIPYAGSLFCAQRTAEHRQMYREGEEAVFWSDAAECARLCRELLDDEQRRTRIAVAGRERIKALKLSHVDVLAGILAGLEQGGRFASSQILPLRAASRSSQI